MSALRVAVVGAGPMGRLHARAVGRRARAVGDCTLAWVVDRHPSRSEAVVAEFGGRAAESLDACLGTIDAAVVAVPTLAHAGVTGRLLERGVDVLLEKPMTADPALAQSLLEQAEACGRVLVAGHVEWFNPAWREALAAAGTPRRIEVERRSPSMDRGLDIDVVQDFMLHDLDWIRRALGGDVARVSATGRRVANAGFDEATAELVFDSGQIARLHASRVDRVRRRVVRIEGADGTVEADLLAGGGESTDLSEPLDHQWVAFLSACAREGKPENDAREGLETLRLVERVRRAIVADEGA